MLNIKQLLLLFWCIQPIYLYAQDSYKILYNSVLMHYNEKRDTLAGKAARFILDNIKYHYFYDGKVLEQYYEDVDSISKNIRYPENIKAYQNINSFIDKSYKTNAKVYDYERLKAEDLIRDVAVSNENAVFSGRQSFDYYATIKCSEEEFSGIWGILCTYDSGTLSCEIY